MMGTDQLSKPEDAPYDSTAMVRGFLKWLDKVGPGAIPTRLLPPIDHRTLIRARTEAERIARASGRIDDLHRYRQEVIDWAMTMFRRYGLYPVYFTGHTASAEVKVEAVEAGPT